MIGKKTNFNTKIVMFTSIWFVGSGLLRELNLVNMIFLEIRSTLFLKSMGEDPDPDSVLFSLGPNPDPTGNNRNRNRKLHLNNMLILQMLDVNNGFIKNKYMHKRSL